VEDQLNPAGADYSRGRILRLLKQHGSEPPKAIVDSIVADLDQFREGTPITDDQTAIAIRVLE
jgi:serine phosphatase RsbU (regulator of sigma subunit)